MLYLVENTMDTQSIGYIGYEASMAVSEAAHDCEFGMLAEQYNYVCENGAFMSLDEAEGKAGNLVTRAIHKIIESVKTAIDKLIGKIKDLIEAIKRKFSNHRDNKAVKMFAKVIDKGEISIKELNKLSTTMKSNMHKMGIDGDIEACKEYAHKIIGIAVDKAGKAEDEIRIYAKDFHIASNRTATGKTPEEK